ncbi:hypothetical protein [Leucobacter sp. OH1287]|uniref:hypothetical protein n=1 Tax=Leucobacter sp. OH1287 TaxID=2491049 RepID=UPI000F5DC2C5|nr:hypothetical protein [Leucobacter sp. OH1287]RRD59521.1 hypothetical protein EII30_08535 [Leucobacter sp. OH1287]
MELKKDYAPLVNIAALALETSDRQLDNLRGKSELSYELAKDLEAKFVTASKITQLRGQIPQMEHIEEKFCNSYARARSDALDFINETREVGYTITSYLLAEVFGSKDTPHERGLNDGELAENLLLFHALALAVIECSQVAVVDDE